MSFAAWAVLIMLEFATAMVKLYFLFLSYLELKLNHGGFGDAKRADYGSS